MTKSEVYTGSTSTTETSEDAGASLYAQLRAEALTVVAALIDNEVITRA